MSIKNLGAPTGVLIMTLVIFVIILFLGVSVLFILIHVCVVGRAFRAGVGGGIVVEGESNRTASMSQDDLEKLPCYNYVAKSKESSVNCAVCLENFEDGDKCRLLPMCKHSFHAHCVDAWLLKRPMCPICRTNADSRRLALTIDEESNHFGDNVRESHTGESSDVIVELEQSQEENTPYIVARIESTQTQPTTVPALDNTSEPHV